MKMHLFLQGYNVYVQIHLVSQKRGKNNVYLEMKCLAGCCKRGSLIRQTATVVCMGKCGLHFMFLLVQFRQRQEGCTLNSEVMRKKTGEEKKEKKCP